MGARSTPDEDPRSRFPDSRFQIPGFRGSRYQNPRSGVREVRRPEVPKNQGSGSGVGVAPSRRPHAQKPDITLARAPRQPGRAERNSHSRVRAPKLRRRRQRKEQVGRHREARGVRGRRRGAGAEGQGGGRPSSRVISANERNPENRRTDTG